MTKADHLYEGPRRHDRGAGCVVLLPDGSPCGRPVRDHPSAIEAAFEEAVARARLQEGMVREHVFAGGIGRKWRFDRAWPVLRVAVELDGGGFLSFGGRHGGARDRDKDNAAGLLGWQVLTFDAQHVRLGLAVAQLRAALAIRQAPPAERPRLRAVLRPEWFPTDEERRAALQELKRVSTHSRSGS